MSSLDSVRLLLYRSCYFHLLSYLLYNNINRCVLIQLQKIDHIWVARDIMPFVTRSIECEQIEAILVDVFKPIPYGVAVYHDPLEGLFGQELDTVARWVIDLLR